MDTTTETATAAAALIAPADPYALSPEDARFAAIAEFISAIADEVKGLVKDGTHDNQGWKFISYEQVYGVLKPALSQHRVRLVPVSSSATYDTLGKFRVCTLTVQYRLVTPVGSMPIEVVAEGADTSDKATTKAWTYAKKTAYTQLFDLAVDIDPDSTGGDVVASKKEADEDKIISERIRLAHQMADKSNVAGLRGLFRATASLHTRKVQVVPWWSEYETRVTEFGSYLVELGERVAKATDKR